MVGAEEADRLFAYLVQEQVVVFYIKLAVEFDTLGNAQRARRKAQGVRCEMCSTCPTSQCR